MTRNMLGETATRRRYTILPFDLELGANDGINLSTIDGCDRSPPEAVVGE
jgi:hypothetical protein